MSDDQPKMVFISLAAKPLAGWFSMIERGSFQTLFLGIIAGVMVVAALDAASSVSVSNARVSWWFGPHDLIWPGWIVGKLLQAASVFHPGLHVCGGWREGFDPIRGRQKSLASELGKLLRGCGRLLHFQGPGRSTTCMMTEIFVVAVGSCQPSPRAFTKASDPRHAFFPLLAPETLARGPWYGARSP